RCSSSGVKASSPKHDSNGQAEHAGRARLPPSHHSWSGRDHPDWSSELRFPRRSLSRASKFLGSRATCGGVSHSASVDRSKRLVLNLTHAMTLPQPLPISCYIRTLNEQRRIAEVVGRARQLCEEVIVVDSGSTDDTVELARSAGARIILQKWLGG